MAKVESRGVSGAGIPPVLYQDAAQLQGLKSELDRKAKATEGRDLTPARLNRDKYWARPSDGAALLSPPVLPSGATQRPDAKTMFECLKSVVQQRTPSPAAFDAERRLYRTLQDLVKAQEGIMARLAKMTKA